MITTAGKSVIKNYFGGQTGRIGDTFAFGTGTTAATLADTELDTEVIRVSLSAITADLANNRIVFKGTLPARPEEDALEFTEVGLYHIEAGVETLVSRVVLGSPQSTNANLPTDVEYSLEISV